MNKQEKEDLVNQLNSRLSNCPSGSWDKGYNEGLMNAVIVVKNLPTVDEPQKVKVKQFVADWFEEHKDFLELSLGMITPDIRTKIAQGQALSEFEKWFNRTRNKPFETIIRMKNGYEIEEEPKVVNILEKINRGY